MKGIWICALILLSFELIVQQYQLSSLRILAATQNAKIEQQNVVIKQLSSNNDKEINYIEKLISIIAEHKKAIELLSKITQYHTETIQSMQFERKYSK